ncbi:hypothetical protein OPQ81_004134 [Rhizoctonia solani]|nr:hypothetical protein OPQ81_004134 [Rhizoctonia solani]
MQALHGVIKAGYARYIGKSSCYAHQFQAMQNYGIANNLTPFISMQNHYSLVCREEEREMIPTLKMFGVGSISWSPLARQQTTRGKPIGLSEGMERLTKGITRSSDVAVEALAKKKNLTIAQVTLAWIMSKDQVSVPVVGTTNLSNLEELVAAVNVNLSS